MAKAATKATRPQAARGLRGRSPRRASAKVQQLVRTVRQQSAIAGKCWDKSEAALEELQRCLGDGRIVGIEDGVFCFVEDLFAKSASVIVPKAMRRYRLVICDAAGKTIRLRDRRQRQPNKKKR